MKIGKNNKMTAFLLLGVGVVLCITIWNAVISENQSLKKVVQQEDIYCISAICLSEDTGIKCLDLDPAISHMIITGDPQVRDANRLIIKPTSESCGRSSVRRDANFEKLKPEPVQVKLVD